MLNYGIRYEYTPFFTRPRRTPTRSSRLTVENWLAGSSGLSPGDRPHRFYFPRRGVRVTPHSFAPRPATAAFAA